jgi:hypothetical protein
MSYSRDDIYRVKHSIEKDYLENHPDVTGVGIGIKEVQGEPVGSWALVFSVQAKQKSIPIERRLPTQIEGIPVDVIEAKMQHTFGADTSFYASMVGGIGIAPQRMVNGGLTAGTLGLIVRDATTSNPMILSNAHVLMGSDGKGQRGDSIVQPAAGDDATQSRQVATLTRGVDESTIGDAAVAMLLDTISSQPGVIQGVGAVVPASDSLGGVQLQAADVTNAIQLHKRGRTTKGTSGTLVQVDYSYKITNKVTGSTHLFIDSILIKSPLIGFKFSDAGDSGSVLYNDRHQVVGLLAAGDPERRMGRTYAAGHHIVPILGALSVFITTR